MSAPYFVDIISEVVTRVQNDSTKPAALAADEPFFMHGHPLEIINTLNNKDKHDTEKFNKYPLIALFQDFTETVGDHQAVRSSASLNLIIATETSHDYTSDQRYDVNFRLVLYPLYDLLIKHIVQVGWFRNIDPGLVPHEKIDRLYWGRTGVYMNEASIFNDRIDAIEIQNLFLEIGLRQTCT